MYLTNQLFADFPPHDSSDCYHSCTCMARCVSVVHRIFLSLGFVLWGKKNQGSSVCWAVNGINSNGMQLNVRNVQREGLRGESNRFRKLFLQPYFGWVGFSCFCLVLSDKIFWASWNLKWEGSWSLTLLLFSHSFSLVVLCHKERMIEAWFAHRGVRVWWCPLAKLLLGPWPRMTKTGIRETECT